MYELNICYCGNNPLDIFHNGKWHCVKCYIAIASSEQQYDDGIGIDDFDGIDDE